MLLAAAGVELLRAHGLLAEHAVALGYADKLLAVLAAHAPKQAPLADGARLSLVREVGVCVCMRLDRHYCQWCAFTMFLMDSAFGHAQSW